MSCYFWIEIEVPAWKISILVFIWSWTLIQASWMVLNTNPTISLVFPFFLGTSNISDWPWLPHILMKWTWYYSRRYSPEAEFDNYFWPQKTKISLRLGYCCIWKKPIFIPLFCLLWFSIFNCDVESCLERKEKRLINVM